MLRYKSNDDNQSNKVGYVQFTTDEFGYKIKPHKSKY